MLLYVKPTDADEVSCPYIDGELFIQRYAVMKDLSEDEFDMMLLNGWRHFGYYFFMPNCRSCSRCQPIRTLVNEFSPTKSQRRNYRKNISTVEVSFEDLFYTDEIFQIYKKHSKDKFKQESSEKEFRESFFSDALSGSSKLALYRLEGKLVGVGFIDISKSGLSSVYFCYDTDYSNLGLGVFSVLREIEYAKELGKEYYYLGYYIEENDSMKYKGRYAPYEILSWSRGEWIRTSDSVKPARTVLS